MDQLFKKVHDVDPNNSDAVKEVLNIFFQNLPKHNDFNCNRWLRELLIIVNRYPKYCMTHRNNIETFLSSFLSSGNYHNVIEAAKCAHTLQQVRPIQEKTATPKSSWRQMMTGLCNAAHSLIDVVFSDAVDIYRSNDKPQETQLNSPLSNALANITKKTHDKNKSLLMQTRLKNVFTFIQAMLVETYPVPKPVQPRTLLDVIVRALSISSQQVDVDVASVKIQALKSLDAVIICLGPNFIPYSPLVFRVVTQTLRWSSENLSITTSKVRCAAYSTLSKWLLKLHIYKMPDKSTWENELSKHIITDITPAKKVVTLTMGPQPTKNLSKKAKRKLANSQLLESSIAAHMPGEKNKLEIPEEVNNEVTISALEFAEVFLTVCGRFLKPATHKLFQERVVRNYTTSDTLLYLRLLEATRKTTPANTIPPTQYCLSIYSTLVNSTCAEISKFCTQALLDIRLHLHCSPPSVNLALEIPQEKEESINKRKKVSTKNRAMLEYLLGADKVPKPKEDDIISIPDEPSSKKQRLDELDKISLSSDDSASTVKLTYESEISSSDEDNVMEVDVVVEMNESREKNRCIENLESVQNKALIVAEEQSDKINEQHDQINEIDTSTVVNVQLKEVKYNDKSADLHEAPTQIMNTSNDEEESHSLEVAYDYPNTGTNKITVLERNEVDNLPSTNETDEDQITCGQKVQSSQEFEEISQRDEEPKVNGVDETVENGIESNITDPKITSIEEVKIVAKIDGASVEDMLADFVDEVNEAVAMT